MHRLHLSLMPRGSADCSQLKELSSVIAKGCRITRIAVLIVFTLSAQAVSAQTDSDDLPFPPHPGCYEYHGCVDPNLPWKEKERIMRDQWFRWGFPTPPAQFAFRQDGRLQSTSWAYNDGSTVTCKPGGATPSGPWTCKVKLSKYAQCRLSDPEGLMAGGAVLAGVGGTISLLGGHGVGEVLTAVGAITSGVGGIAYLGCRGVEFGD